MSVPSPALSLSLSYGCICLALQVSGLKSITSKHLALASQVISFIYAIMPGISNMCLLKNSLWYAAVHGP